MHTPPLTNYNSTIIPDNKAY